MKKIILATHNLGKVRELQELLKELPLEIKFLNDYPNLTNIEETGKTFRENAGIKAATVVSATGIPTIADDSGLEVEILEGAPGVYSSRYAGKEGDDAANNEKLLRELAGTPLEERKANFRSLICLKLKNGEEIYTEGICQGKIAFEPKGNNGFGYDPLFLVEPDFNRTMAELAMEEKNLISHRGRASKELKTIIERLLKEDKF